MTDRLAAPLPEVIYLPAVSSSTGAAVTAVIRAR